MRDKTYFDQPPSGQAAAPVAEDPPPSDIGVVATPAEAPDMRPGVERSDWKRARAIELGLLKK